VGRMAKQIKAMPLMIIPPPAIAPRAITVGCPIIDAATSGAAQIMAPMIQSAVPSMIFIRNRSDVNDAVRYRSLVLRMLI
jgi:hypothetical protein